MMRLKGRHRKKWKDSSRGVAEQHSSEADKQQTIMKISGSRQEDILFSQTTESHERQQQK